MMSIKDPNVWRLGWLDSVLCNMKAFAKRIYSLTKTAEWQLAHWIRSVLPIPGGISFCRLVYLGPGYSRRSMALRNTAEWQSNWKVPPRTPGVWEPLPIVEISWFSIRNQMHLDTPANISWMIGFRMQTSTTFLTETSTSQAAEAGVHDTAACLPRCSPPAHGPWNKTEICIFCLAVR